MARASCPVSSHVLFLLLGYLDTSQESPMPWVPCRQRTPALGGSLPRDQHRVSLGQGQRMALNPSLRSRQAAGGGRQQAGMIDKKEGAGVPCSSSPPTWKLAQCVPHHQSTGGWTLCEQLGHSRGRSCHSVSHLARLTGNGWYLQRARCPKALFLCWGSYREQWGGDEGESV